MKRQREVLMSDYMKKFKCIGSECEDSCCIGWRVNIDKKTYQKYKNTKDSQMQEIVKEHIKRNRNNGSEDNYASIKMIGENACPCLDEKGLCKIQLRYGEEYLSSVCTTYPRNVNKVNGTLEYSAALSCPEICRLVLLNREKMSFTQDLELMNDAYLYYKVLDTEAAKNKIGPKPFFWELRIFSIDLMQNREYKIWERLIILGMFYNKAQALVNEGESKKIIDLINEYSRHIERGEFKKILEDIPNNIALQMDIMKHIIESRSKATNLSQGFNTCNDEFLEGLKYTDSMTKDELIKRYEELYYAYYKPYMDNNEHIWENFLVDYIFKNLFPIDDEKNNLFESYMMMIIQYAAIKVFLIGVSGYHKTMNDQLVVKTIQSFAKVVQHDMGFILHIKEFMNANQFNTIGYMSILIKND